jgi:hypothetical protein
LAYILEKRGFDYGGGAKWFTMGEGGVFAPPPQRYIVKRCPVPSYFQKYICSLFGRKFEN